jgi:hypothetical protein
MFSLFIVSFVVFISACNGYYQSSQSDERNYCTSGKISNYDPSVSGDYSLLVSESCQSYRYSANNDFDAYLRIQQVNPKKGISGADCGFYPKLTSYTGGDPCTVWDCKHSGPGGIVGTAYWCGPPTTCDKKFSLFPSSTDWSGVDFKVLGGNNKWYDDKIDYSYPFTISSTLTTTINRFTVRPCLRITSAKCTWNLDSFDVRDYRARIACDGEIPSDYPNEEL